MILTNFSNSASKTLVTLKQFSGSEANSERDKNPAFGPSRKQMKREPKLLIARGLHPKGPETSGATIPFISSQHQGSKPSTFAILITLH